MQLITFNPFGDLQKVEQELDRLWGNSQPVLSMFADSSTLDMYEEDGKLIAKGTNIDKIEATFKDGMLNISMPLEPSTKPKEVPVT